MTKNNTLTKKSLSIASLLVFLIAMFWGVANAQPTNYCNPAAPTGFTSPIYYYCYPAYYAQMYNYPAYYSVRIAEVSIKTTGGYEVFKNTTNPETFENIECFKYFNTLPPATLDIGDTYLFTIKTANVMGYTSYYCYSSSTQYFTMRLFIDWNADGDWVDAGEWINSPSSTNPMNPNPAWRGYYQHWTPTQSAAPYCSTNLMEWTYAVKIPDNVDATKVRMRVTGSYYYPYSINEFYDYGWAKFYNQGQNPCLNAYAYDYYSYGYSYVYAYGETEDYTLEFQLPLKNSFPSDTPPNDILFAGELYNGTTRTMYDEAGDPYQWYFEKPFIEFKAAQANGSSFKYEIKGPMPSTNTVYQGLDANGNQYIDLSGKTKVVINKSTGIYSPTGNGDLKITSGGEYQLWITLRKPNGQEKVIIKKFTASWLNDLSVAAILSPIPSGPPRFFKYPPEVPIPITAEFQNVGLKKITKFKAIAKIYTANGQLFWTRTVQFDSDKPEWEVLYPKGKVTIEFPTFVSTSVDNFRLEIVGVLESATDLEEYNDVYPRPDANNYNFQVQAEIEIGAIDIINPVPGSTIYAGKAIRPAGLIENFGVSDVSNVQCSFVIKHIQSGKTYTLTGVMQDVPSGAYNKKIMEFDGFIFNEPGDYEATFTVLAQGDFVPSNNSVTKTFKVVTGINNVVKVGQGQSIPSLEALTNDLYSKGVGGDAIIELTDSEYHMYSPTANAPAWDLSSMITGLGYDPVTKTTRKLIFKPSAQKATQKGSITIHLWSLSGKGIYFGQNRTPANPNAPVYTAPTYSIMKQYMNTPGYIEFDGGPNKSIRVVLHSYSSNQGQAFFLGRGSHNITIKNLIIENASPKIADKYELPRMRWTPADGFRFTADSIPTADRVYGFSAGIASRSTLTNDIFESSVLRVDTLPNSNNKFIGNEISGFGYGIVTIGIGPLINPAAMKYVRYYNKNNEISNNIIWDVERAGIFLGFEEDTKVSGNRIYNVKSTVSEDSYGIEAGAYPSNFGGGYNNVNLTIVNNEISGLADSREVAGIRLFQNIQNYPAPLGGYMDFPDIPDNFKVYNNIIWGINNTNQNGSRYGVLVMNDRTGSVFTPKNPRSFGNKLLFANNTIILPDDGIVNFGNQACFASMHFTEVKVYNNAFAILDNGINNSNSLFDAAVVYEGLFPSANTFVSDHNAFYLGNNDNLSHFRFYHIDSESNVIEAGYNNEFKSLLQWQMYTKNDFNSVTGWNFTNDFVVNIDLPQYLRVKSYPAPTGSVLNNRGKRLTDEFTTDITGKIRGEGGYPYDIGAQEFDGLMYVRDIEPLFIVSPGNYRQTSPRQFSEAEYFMTTAPVDVTVRLHNPGSMVAVNVPVTVTIEMQNPDGTFGVALQSVSNIVRMDPFTFQDLSFNLADGQGQDFVPKTYYELMKQGLNYIIPNHFVPMKENVTPVYRITIKAENDLNNDNNTVTKLVRFYIQKSGFEMMVNANTDLSTMPTNPNVNEIARRLNYTAIQTGLKSIGFEKDPAKDRFDFDFFNRDGWEPRALDYTIYRTIFWVEGDNEVSPENFDIYDLNAIERYLLSGKPTKKKNFILASQEYARLTTGTPLGDFISEYFHVADKTPSNPLGAGGNYNGYTIKGVGIARNIVETIKTTDYVNDGYPQPAYLKLLPSEVGLTQIAYKYEKLGNFAPADAPDNERVMGSITATQAYNAVYFGIDWRHFSKLDNVMRGILDFATQYDGNILPVNLLSFEANQIGTRVDLNWITASEFNSSHFEVEKANVDNDFIGVFNKIATVNSVGNSANETKYGPVTDNQVQFGKTYAYRLKMVDKDGSYSYSDVRKVTIKGLEGVLQLSEITPNPASNNAKVLVTVSEPMIVNIEIIDLNGRKVLEVMNGTLASTREINFNLSTIPSGTYTLVLRSGDILLTKTFTVTK